MPRHGENIRKRKDGRWEGRYICGKSVGGKSKYRSIYGHSYSEIREKLFVIRHEQEVLFRSVSDDTMDKVAEKWLLQIKATRKHATYIKYQTIYRTHLARYLQEHKAVEFSRNDILSILKEECFFDLQSREPLSYSTVASIKNVLLQIFNMAGVYFPPINVGKEIGIKEKSTREIVTFNQKEQECLFNFLQHEMDSYKLGILICFYTGLRLGEICALECGDINLEKNILYVRRTVQRIRTADDYYPQTTLQVGEPKSAYSRREVPICTPLKQILSRSLPDTIYVVNQDNLMEPRTYQYKFQHYLKQLSLPAKNFHAIRHTFATNCIAGGMDVKCLSAILGHTDVKITLNRYVHPSWENMLQQLNDVTSIYG